MFQKIFNLTVAILLAAVICGCSIFVPHKQSININGTPSGAKAVVNGNTITVPATISVRRDKNVNIIVSKPGHEPHMMSSSYSLSPWGVLDIVGGIFFLFPFVGLIAPGAYELDQENYTYYLAPAK